MDCPKGHGALETVPIGSIRVDRCARCGGTWYDVDELRLLKDKEASGDYRWSDFDLWKESDKFRSDKQERYVCPGDGNPMTTVHYGESPVAVDICSKCRGVWLDAHEYKRIVADLGGMADAQTTGDYLNDVRDEFKEIFTGPAGPITELKHLGRVLYLLQLRFVVEHPRLGTFLNSLPRF